MSNTALRGYFADKPQSEPLRGRENEQIVNTAGGHVFPVDDFKRAERFLVIGTEGGTYYIGQSELTEENAAAVIRCIESDGSRLVDLIVDISVKARAPKNDQALFALALAVSHGDSATQGKALANLSRVARTGTHLFQFIGYLKQMRGFGRRVRRAIREWYTEKNLDQIAYQTVKYRQRDGWSHRDVLRLAHPKTTERGRQKLFKWIADPTKYTATQSSPQILDDFVALQRAGNLGEVVSLIEANKNISHEMIPSRFDGEAKVWDALLPNLPMTALIRSIPILTRLGLLTPLGENTRFVANKLTNKEALKGGRIHPIQMLVAMNAYSSGKSRGGREWEAVPQIVESLEEGFHASFGNLERIDKSLYIGLDVSASMGWTHVGGLNGMTAAQASAAMAMCFARQCDNYLIRAFSNGYSWNSPRMKDIQITRNQSLRDVAEKVRQITMGGTDCSRPMVDAMEGNLRVDAFVILTDNETWAGRIHPSEAIKQYRSKSGIPAKVAVAGMASNGFSIADPKDAGMMDFVGFDASAPKVLQDFIVDYRI